MSLTTIIFVTCWELSVCKVTLVFWFWTVVLRVVVLNLGHSEATGECVSVMGILFP